MREPLKDSDGPFVADMGTPQLIDEMSLSVERTAPSVRWGRPAMTVAVAVLVMSALWAGSVLPGLFGGADAIPGADDIGYSAPDPDEVVDTALTLGETLEELYASRDPETCRLVGDPVWHYEIGMGGQPLMTGCILDLSRPV